MARFEGPVRFRFNGDPELARQYMAVGRNLLGEINERMERGNLAQLSRVIRNQDGTYIKAYSGYGENQIEIFREELEEEEEIEISGTGFVTVPASDEAPDGWGEPFFDEDGNPINPPLGTIGGQYPVTWLDFNPEEGSPWVAKRHPEYDTIWPAGPSYGNYSWATSRGGASYVLSFNISGAPYDITGRVGGGPDIFFRGNRLCGIGEGAVRLYGVCLLGDFLVSVGENVSGDGLLWRYRPFIETGYSNDDDYDAQTNPVGWRVCSGPGASGLGENITFDTIVQPMSINSAGSSAVMCYLRGSIFFDGGTVQGRWNLTVVADIVFVTFTEDGETLLLNSVMERSITRDWECSLIGPGLPEPYNITESVTHSLPIGGATLVLFREYDTSGQIVSFTVTFPSASRSVFEGKVGINSFTGFFDVVESASDDITYPGLIDLGGFPLSYQTNLSDFDSQTRVDELGEYLISSSFSRNEIRTLVLLGNLGLGYWLIYEFKNDIVDAGETQVNNSVSRFYILEPDGNELDIITLSTGNHLIKQLVFPITFLEIDYVFWEPPGGWCDISIIGPAYNIQRNGTVVDEIPVDNDVRSDYGNYFRQAIIPKVNNQYDMNYPDDTLDISFAAHEDGIGHVIVTAWVDLFHKETFEDPGQRYFAAYEFLTDGDVPALTQVQGDNQRHNSTGVI